MKALFVSAGFLATSALPGFSQVSGQTSRVDELERKVAELRLVVDKLQQQLSSFINEQRRPPARAEVVAPPRPDYHSPSSSSGGNYRIKSGDTLWQIARRHGVSVKALQRSNPRLDPKRLRVGARVTIPGARSSSHPSRSSASVPRRSSGKNYRVKSGDTFGHIAKAYGIPVTSLMAANPGINPRRLLIGKKISIPGSGNAKVARKKPSPPRVPASPPTPRPSLPDPIPSPPPLPQTIVEDEPKLITVEQTRRLSYLAELYGTNVRTLNQLNEVDLPPNQMIKAGSQIYIPR